MRILKILIASTLILLACSLAGCGSQATTPASEAPKFSPATYPTVDGSTVTIPLSEALGAKLMNLPIEEARQYIVHNKTHQAYLNLINGSAALIFVTSPSAEELQIAKESNVKLELIPIVSEGFIFLVNKDNPVNSLTLKQIQDIYTGKITNWKDVAGTDTIIKAYQRPVNSGSQTGFLDLVMGGLTPVNPPTEQIISEMAGLIEAVATYKNEPDAIGYSYFYFATDMWGNEKVKLLAVNGVVPSKETIRDGSYPIRTAYYAAIRSTEAKDSPARQIISWLLTKDGQQLAEEAGYVPIK
ncbi:MAG: substrate-binding domain-containing protein [Eubacteriales bacterium]